MRKQDYEQAGNWPDRELNFSYIEASPAAGFDQC